MKILVDFIDFRLSQIGSELINGQVYSFYCFVLKPAASQQDRSHYLRWNFTIWFIYFGVQEISVSEGDRFFLYSDGLIERIEEKKVWTVSKERLLDACESLRKMPFNECAEALPKQILGNESSPEDDIVVLGIEV